MCPPRPHEGRVAADGGAAHSGGDAEGGGAKTLFGVAAGGTATAGESGRLGHGWGQDDQRTGSELFLTRQQ